MPDEWFRAQSTPPTGARAGAGDPSGSGEETFTDQFKPGYLPHESASRTKSIQATDPGFSTVSDTGTGERPAGSFGSNAAGVTYSVGEIRQQPTPSVKRRSGAQVRRVIQTGLLLSGALILGLVGGLVLLSNETLGNGSSSSSPVAASASASGPGPYSGPLVAIAVSGVTATKTQSPLPGSDGKPVSYAAANVLDDVAATAWRCPGDGSGQKLSFVIPANTTLVGMGLVNGYTKVQSDGVNLYERYRRVLKVQWSLPDGSFVSQSLTDHVQTEQVITIPATVTNGPVLMTIEQTSTPGSTDSVSDATLISRVRLYTQP